MGEGLQFHLMVQTARATARTVNPFLNQPPLSNTTNFMNMKMKMKLQSQTSQRNGDSSPITKKLSRKNNGFFGNRLITVSTSDGRWNGKWNTEYLVSLRDLKLQDLVEVDEDQDQQHPQVSINLSIEKHASFGLSVDGRIITSFTRKCSNCSSPFCRKIDTSFKVWILMSSRENRNNDNLTELPEIGGDPSVMYVKRDSYEANLDSIVQDTIRLTTTIQDTCSEPCEKSQPTIQYIGTKKTASMDQRWGKLLKIRNALIR